MNDEKIALFKVKIKKYEDAEGKWVSIDWTTESGEYEDVDNFILPLEYALNVHNAGSWLMPPYTRDWRIDLDLPGQPEMNKEDHEILNTVVKQVLKSMESSEEDSQE